VTAYYNEHEPSRFIAYVITNAVNGKQYVGVTVRGLRRRWTDHVRAARDGVATALYAAMRKHGVEAFTIEHCACALGRDDLAHVERNLIAQLGTLAPLGYNLTIGGDGVAGLPRWIVERTANLNRGRHQSERAKELIGSASRGHLVSTETRRALREAHIGKTLTAEHRAKLSAAKIGKRMPPRSAEHRARISAGLVVAHARRRASRA
jgi:group I intron endonuclease